jgi:polar amino acid transport system permease protein
MEDKSKPPLSTKELIHIPGAEPSARLDAWWWLVAAVIVITISLCVFLPDPFWRIFVFVSDGIWTTVKITVLSFIFTLVVGLFGGLGRLSKNKIIYSITSFYVEVVRGIPLMVQLIWWYFAFPTVVQDLGRSLNLQFLVSYQANAIPMAIIPKGQMEAARSLGMNYIQSMRYVILPQAIRVILPPVGNEFISLLKDSSLVSVVAVVDLTRRGREFMSFAFIPIETWTMVALIYLIMTLVSARVVNYVERKTRFER